MALPRPARWSDVALFFALTFLLTHGSVAVFLALGGSFHDPVWLKFSMLAMLFPALSAVLVVGLRQRASLRDRLALGIRPNRWWWLAWAVGPIVCGGTLGASLLLPWVTYDPAVSGIVGRGLASPEQHAQVMSLARALGVSPTLVLVLPMIVLAPTVGMINACGEEIGWRGFLYGETEGLGFWRQCLLVGALWWLWHAPLVFFGYGGYPDALAGSIALFGVVLLSTPIVNYVRLRSGSSLAAGLTHSALGGGTLLAVGPTTGGTPLSTGYGSFTSVAVLVVANLVLFAADHASSPTPLIGRRSSTTAGDA